MRRLGGYGESYDEARTDLALRIIGGLVAEGVTDQGTAGMLRQRINESLNAHRAGVQRRVVNALNQQERAARNDAYRQAQRIVKAAGEANRKRMEAEREAWAKTGDKMRTALARSEGAVQRARDARSADVLRRQIAADRTKLNRMLLHPSEQYHVPRGLMQAAIQVAELANHYTYNKAAVDRLQVLKGQLADMARAAEGGGVDSIEADWKNSGIPDMLSSLTTSMERTANARLKEQAAAQARRMESGQKVLEAQKAGYESMGLGDRRLYNFSLEELRTLRDVTRAMVTVIQNSNRLLATQTAQNAAEFASVAVQEVATSAGRKKEKAGRLRNWAERYTADVYNAQRYLKRLGGYRHGGAMELLADSLAAGEQKKTDIKARGMQIIAETGVLANDKETSRARRAFAGRGAELVDIGLRDEAGNAVEINHAQLVSIKLHSLNSQNLEHMTRGGLVIPDMQEYNKGHIEEAYRKNRTVRVTGEVLEKIDSALTEYDRKWIDAAQKVLDGYTKGVINETSQRLNGYDKATVEHYYPLAVDPDVLQQEIEGAIYNGTIEGRGFLKARQEHGAAPVLLEEVNQVLARSLADAAAYGGLAPAIRDANKIWNANHQEGASLYATVRKAYGDDAVKYVKNYLSDLQTTPRERRSIVDMLNGVRGRYAGAVLTFNYGIALGQLSGLPTAAAELGWGPTIGAAVEMLPNGGGHKDKLRQEMMDYGYWGVEDIISDGAGQTLEGMRNSEGLIGRMISAVPTADILERMDIKTRLAIWQGSKDYVANHIEEYGLSQKDAAEKTAAYRQAVVAKMTEVCDRTQPQYTVSQKAAIQRNSNPLAQMLAMFKTQNFQNYGILAGSIGDLRAQMQYVREAEQKLRDGSLGAEERQQAQAGLEKAKQDRGAAWAQVGRAVSSQIVQQMVFVAAKMLWDDLVLHRWDEEKDENGDVTAAAVAKRFGSQVIEGQITNMLLAGEVMSIGGNFLGVRDDTPVSMVGVDAIADFASDMWRLSQAIERDEEEDDTAYAARLQESLLDLAGSAGNLAGIPAARIRRLAEGIKSWADDYAATRTGEVSLKDIVNAPQSSASQYDRMYAAVFETSDPDEAQAAMEKLQQLDRVTPPAKASNAKAADGQVLGELLKREREYGDRVQSAAADRVAGNEGRQRQLRQELVNVLAGALGIDQDTREGQRRLRTVIDKVDSAIADEVREQMGADSKTGATVYTPLLTALEEGGDVSAAQAALRLAGVDDSDIRSKLTSLYKEEYIYGDETARRDIERRLLRLEDAYGEPYYTKTEEQDDFADWVTDWTLQGLNDSVYTDLTEALQTKNRESAMEQIRRYMEAGKEAGSIRSQITKLYKREYQNASREERQELARFLCGLRGINGEKFITTDTLMDWLKETMQ